MKKILITCCSLLAFTTYITQEIYGFGEYIAEAVPLALGLFYLLSLITINRNNGLTIAALIYLSLMMIVTIINLFVEQSDMVRILFGYSYIPIILMTSFNKELKDNSEFILKAIAYVGATSAIVGIMQFMDIQQIIPVDINRARGLSRSTLNYSALMALAYIAADNIKLKWRWLLKLIIFLGAVSSLGRGGVIGIIVYQIIVTMNKPQRLMSVLLILTVLIGMLMQFKLKNIDVPDNIQLTINKFYYALDFENDPGNADRIGSYLRIKEEFRIMGAGFGSTGPGAERFNPSATGFESYILALLYQGGIILFMGWVLLFYLIYKNKIKLCKIKYLAVISSYITMMAAQQTFETPSVNITAWLVMLAITHRYCFIPQLKLKSNAIQLGK